MRSVLVVGGGGREHALAVTLRQSPGVGRVMVSPGNGGTGDNVGPDTPADLVVVGPEAPLVDGLADRLRAAGRRCFGPLAAAARLEGDKAFAKELMARLGLPTAPFRVFDSHGTAREWVARAERPVVVKAAGLAAGKGVIVPGDREEAVAAVDRLMLRREVGAAGDVVVVEDPLEGTEASVLAFTDGETLSVMPVAQDHKRLLAGDRGPNTGGMGAFAPAGTLGPAEVDRVRRHVLEPVIGAFAAEGVRYVGVIYAGLMLTRAGPQVLEFNCRFGDPEAQAILPLLETELDAVIDACIDGELRRFDVRWSDLHAVAVVAAARGYPGAPEKGAVIEGVDEAEREALVFHAGTTRDGDMRLRTSGGRVLAVTGVGRDRWEAAARAYAGMARVRFEGMQVRGDVGRGGE